MKSPFQTLSRIQKFNIDEQQKVLASLLREEEGIEEELARRAQELEEEKSFSKDQNNNRDFASYLECYLQKKDALEQSLAAVRKKIEEAKDVLVELFKEKKTYDIVEQNRQGALSYEEGLKEQKMLDEIGTNNYLKRKKH